MPKIRHILIFAVIAIIFILIYIFFVKSSPDTPALVTTSPNPSGDVSLPSTGDSSVANDFLNLLLSVKNIKLEDSIFADDAFKSLRDSSIVLIPDGTEGRPNPFAPIGSDSVPPPVNISPQTTSPATTPATTPSTPTTTPPPATR